MDSSSGPSTTSSNTSFARSIHGSVQRQGLTVLIHQTILQRRTAYLLQLDLVLGRDGLGWRGVADPSKRDREHVPEATVNASRSDHQLLPEVCSRAIHPGEQVVEKHYNPHHGLHSPAKTSAEEGRIQSPGIPGHQLGRSDELLVFLPQWIGDVHEEENHSWEQSL